MAMNCEEQGDREMEKTAQRGASWSVLLTWYYPGAQTKKNEMGRVCGTVEGEGAYNVLVTKHEEKKPLGRPRHRWVDNIKLDLKKLC